jgi:hypothetical protein
MILAYLVVIVLAVGTRLFQLTSHSLWIDEGISLILTSGDSLPQVLRKTFERGLGHGTQPVYFLLLAQWRQVLGDSDASLRGLSVVLGVGAVVATLLASRRAFGSKHAIWAGLFVATSSFAVYYSQEVRPYALLLFACATLLWAYVSAATASSLRITHVAAVVGSAAFAIASGFVSTLLLVALALADLITGHVWRKWLAIWMPAALLCLPFLIGFFILYGSDFSSAGGAFTTGNPVRNLVFVPYGILVGQTFGPPLSAFRYGVPVDEVLALAPLFLLLVATTLIVLWRLRLVFLAPERLALRPPSDRVARSLIVALLLSFSFGGLHLFLLDYNWLPRRAYYLFPLVSLVLPLATRTANSRLLAAAPVTVLIALNLFSLGKYYFDPQHRRDDYRSVVAYLSSDEMRTVPAVLLQGEIEVMRHYGDRQTVPGGRIADDPNELDTGISNLTAGAKRVALVINREWDFETSYLTKHESDYHSAMARTYELVEEKEFPLIKVYVYETRDSL